MTGPNMATITASLERSLQNCSLNNHHQYASTHSNNTNSGSILTERSDSSENHILNHSDATLNLNSEVYLPYHWEQCLDLKTGEVYYINWRTGMKVKEDPRKNIAGDLYTEDDSASYDSEGSSSEESSISCSRLEQHDQSHVNSAAILVVAGCKSCLMYFMVPKQVEVCPKCCGQLLHFDRSENGSS